MPGLIAAGWPPNMRAKLGAFVESDVFDICHRILEIDPDLVIVPNDETHAHRFSIHHLDKAGNEYLVMTADVLDARILTDLQYLLHVPFEKRYAEAERLEKENERKRDEAERERLYEKMGYQFYRQLDRCGFIQRSDILPKRSRIAQRYRSQTA